jgi:hypothetical protein
MQSRSRLSWLVLPIGAVIVFATAIFGQRQLRDWTSRQLVRQRREQIAVATDRRAARLVLQLAEDDEQWLEVLVAAWADPRSTVAQAGQVATLGLAERWQSLPSPEGTPRFARLAALLAQHAPQMAPARREAASSLAQQMLDLPLDSRELNSAQFIADCQAVLFLPTAPLDEIRLAALPSAPALPPPASHPPATEPPAALQPLQTPAVPAPAATSVARPVPLPDANRERPAEPQRLPAPKAKAIKISDDE